MDKTVLVEKAIKEGGKLLEALDKAGFKVEAAMWFYVTESDEWRLFIASPFVETDGPTAAYGSIQTVLATLKPSEISLRNISVLSPKHHLISLLRIAIRTGPGISGIRFTRNVINNTLIEDAYIYRIM